MKPKGYDLIVSLGGNCAVANQLKMRQKRKFSLPFDYLFMVDETPIKYLRTGFENRFHDFFLRENMVELVGDERGDDQHGCLQYKDLKTGWRAIHHFTDDVHKNPTSYDNTMIIFRRRIDRLLKKLKRPKRICFILGTPFEFDIMLLDDIRTYFAHTYPFKVIDWYIVMFNSVEYIYYSDIGINGCVYVWKTLRAPNQYDFTHNNIPEWEFLDNIYLRDFTSQFKRWYKSITYGATLHMINIFFVRRYVSNTFRKKIFTKAQKWGAI